MRATTVAGALALALAVAIPAGAAQAAGAAVNIPPNEFAPDREVNRDVPAMPSSHQAPRVIPGQSGQVKQGTPGLLHSFSGLNLVDTRSADGGNAFSAEPPDQGLCTDGSQVLESVNDVFAVYDKKGHVVGQPASLNSFFTHDVAIDRTTGVAGWFISDPKCYWDPGNHHFYFSVLGINPENTRSTVFVSVTHGTTATTNPNDWYQYTIDTTNDGTAAEDASTGTPPAARTLPDHTGCPCLGDQPLIGADKYGFYVTTNEFPLVGPGFNGAQVYALSKDGLASGTFTMQYVLATNLTPGGYVPPLAEGVAYSLQPATSPATGSWETGNNGTEYMLSALDFEATTDNRIAAWAMTNTSSLTPSGTGSVRLENYVIVPSEVYGQPPVAGQRSGFNPLGDAFGVAYDGGPYPVPTLNTNDDRMNQVVYAAGHLWGGLNTVMRTSNGKSAQTNRAGIAWFAVRPSWSASGFGASMANQGYVGVKNNDNAMFPAIGMAASGKGVMTFTVTGQHYYPSAAYVQIDLSGTGPTHIAAAGGMPADGFTGYPPYGGPPERWGDYSAAGALPDGTVWMATEWIPGTFSYATGGWFANWGTYVMHVQP